MYKKNYTTARSVLGFASFTGWLAVAAGAIFTLMSFSEGEMVFLVSAIALVAFGLMQVAMAQVSFAVLDQSDISQESLQVLKAIAAKQGVDLPAPAPETKLALEDKDLGNESDDPVRKLVNGTEIRTYLGTEIIKSGGSHYVDGKPFSTVREAKAAIRADQTNGTAAS